MDWEIKLIEIERNFGSHKQVDWRPSIEMAQQLMAEQPNNVEITIRVIYILHNILVEEQYSNDEHEIMSDLLKKYFDESSQRFSENSEYLFFIGKILYIAEWYFGLEENFDPIEQSMGFKMQEKAFNSEPNNKLYEWSCAFLKGDKERACKLSKCLFFDETKWIDWLKIKGYPGQYLLDSLTSCYKKCEEQRITPI